MNSCLILLHDVFDMLSNSWLFVSSCVQIPSVFTPPDLLSTKAKIVLVTLIKPSGEIKLRTGWLWVIFLELFRQQKSKRNVTSLNLVLIRKRVADCCGRKTTQLFCHLPGDDSASTRGALGWKRCRPRGDPIFCLRKMKTMLWLFRNS